MTKCFISRKKFMKKFEKDKSHWKVRDHFHYTGKYRGVGHSICILKFNVPNEIPVVFYNGLNSDYHFIIKELAKQFEGKFESLEENSEKYKTFFVLIETEKLQKLMKMAIKIL